jgi:hypothetical protein
LSHIFFFFLFQVYKPGLLFSMYSNLVKIAFAALAIEICHAQSPPGFTPAASKHLDVIYGTSAIKPAGITVPVTGK